LFASAFVAGVKGSVGVVWAIDGRNAAVIQSHWGARILVMAGLEWLIYSWLV
jgi:hypothetical protein